MTRPLTFAALALAVCSCGSSSTSSTSSSSSGASTSSAGSIAKDGALNLSGPQTCTGTGSATEISMTCSPGVCVVTLAR